jgi:hypothetical protein
MSEFTPGPWEVFNEGLGSYKVSKCDAWLGSSTLRTNEENLANANLIAAAPELYEALTELYQIQAVSIDEPWDDDRYFVAMEKAEAALKKARGE